MKKYSKSYYHNNGQSGDRVALQMYFRIFKKYVPCGKVLDYGAGYGFLSKRIANKYLSFAYELSSHARLKIKINSPKTVIYDNINFPKNHFEGIISLHCLEHIINPNKMISLFANSLKKGGIVVMVVPNIDGYGYKIKKSKWFGFRDKTHVSLLPSGQWKKYFTDNGFSIIKTGSDWFWDVPYLPLIPNFIQKAIFYPGCLLMVLLGQIIFPEKWGEDLILVARKD